MKRQRPDIGLRTTSSTALPRSVIGRLPRLKLIASTGPRNAAIDVEVAGRARYRGAYEIRCTPHHRDDLRSHPCERASGRIGKGKHTGKEPNQLLIRRASICLSMVNTNRARANGFAG